MDQRTEYHFTMKEMPEEERPRERLLEKGAEYLTNAELLAILFSTGTRSETALQLAEKVLNQLGGLNGLSGASIEEMAALKGVGPAKASRLKATLELAKRLSQGPAPLRRVIASPKDVADFLAAEFRGLDREHFKAVYLDTKYQVLALETVSIGDLSSSSAHPRELFKAGIRRSAAAVILAHNHPSGDPKPSQGDLDMTRRLRQAGELLGIEVLDHLIFGSQRVISLRELGLFQD